MYKLNIVYQNFRKIYKKYILKAKFNFHVNFIESSNNKYSMQKCDSVLKH